LKFVSIMKKKLSIATSIMSLALVAFFIVGENAYESQQVFAAPSGVSENKPGFKTTENISLELVAPKTVYAMDNTLIQINVKDSKSNAPISHVDWALSVKDPNGNIVWKTTTAHSHVGIMNFNVAFPMAGENIISLTANSIGPKMMGMDVPPKAFTHTMISGKLSGFETDPANNFGSRTYEFPVNVMSQKQIRTISGADGTNINVELSTTSDKIVAGQPTTLVLTTTNADGSDPMMTHVDVLLKVRKGYYIGTQSADRGSDMMPMNGAYHGHLGQISLTHTFPSAGNYVISAELNSLGVSKVKFGMTDVRFNIQVAEETSSDTIHNTSTNNSNSIGIIGLESPFYSPNNFSAKVGQTVSFDNIDANFHTVTSGNAASGPDGTFDSGLLSAGDKYSLTLDKPGKYDYFCTIHTNMVGTITVS
jgi:plastocyanin